MAQIPYSSVPDVKPDLEGTGGHYQEVPQANAEAFGAGVGRVEEDAGSQIQKAAEHFQNIYAESTARDATNKTASALADESARFAQLKGKDAIANLKGHEDRIDQIVKDGSNGLSLNANPTYMNQVSGFADRAKMTAGSHAGQQAEVALKSSIQGTIETNQNLFAMNPNDPASEQHIHEVASNSLSLSALNGYGKTYAEAQLSRDLGNTLIAGVHANMQAYPDLANKMTDRALNGSYVMPDGTKIPLLTAEQREHLLTFTQRENQKVDYDTSFNAIMAGSPIPPPIGGGQRELQVKSMVSSNAQKAGNDPNVALMISGLESSFGRTSDNIGGVQGNATMEEKQKEATSVANKLFGGSATPAQIYTVYQQGIGGGPALFDPANANKRAIDVLEQFRTKDYDPIKAVVGNGGNVNMTSSQFTGFLQKKCESMYGMVKCDTTAPDGTSIDLGKAILQPHIQGNVPLQPASNPVDAMKQFNDVYHEKLSAIMGIPNFETRRNLLDMLRQKNDALEGDEKKYKDRVTSDVTDIATQKDFTSIKDPRITQDMRNKIDSLPPAESKAIYGTMKNFADRNAKGTTQAAINTYGDKSWEVATKIQNGEITNLFQLNTYAHEGGLTPEGLRQARQEFNEISNEKKQAYDKIAQTIAPGIDKRSESITLSRYMPQVESEIKERNSRKIPSSDYFDPENKEWIGRGVKQINVSDILKGNIGIDPKTNKLSEDTTSDIVKKIDSANKEKPVTPRTVEDVMFDYSRETDPVKKLALREEAKKLGWTPRVSVPSGPSVPLAGGQ